MKLNELFDLPGARKRKKRVGRGMSSGMGKTSCRGVKGQKARSGVAVKGFEGGQMPLIKRLPKRGFNCPSSKTYIPVNFAILNMLLADKKIKADASIDKELLKKHGILKNTSKKVKLLAKGELKNKFSFQLDAYSEAAKAAIEKAGGKIL